MFKCNLKSKYFVSKLWTVSDITKKKKKIQQNSAYNETHTLNVILLDESITNGLKSKVLHFCHKGALYNKH